MVAFSALVAGVVPGVAGWDACCPLCHVPLPDCLTCLTPPTHTHHHHHHTPIPSHGRSRVAVRAAVGQQCVGAGGLLGNHARHLFFPAAHARGPAPAGCQRRRDQQRRARRSARLPMNEGLAPPSAAPPPDGGWGTGGYPVPARPGFIISACATNASKTSTSRLCTVASWTCSGGQPGTWTGNAPDRACTSVLSLG